MKIMRSVTIALITLCGLAGCATQGQIRDGLQNLMGQPLAAAIAHFGYPASQMQMGDQTVYRWSSNRTLAIPQYNTATTYGNVGGTPFQATTGGMTTSMMPTACELDISVQDGLMAQFSFHGQAAACQAFYIK
jgi:hypothetical protein